MVRVLRYRFSLYHYWLGCKLWSDHTHLQHRFRYVRVSRFKDEPVNQNRGLGNYRQSLSSLFQAVRHLRSILWLWLPICQ